MNKILFLFLLGVCAGYSVPSLATLKFDGAAVTGEVSDSAGTTNETATNQVDVAAEKKQEGIIGPKTKARIEKLKALAKDIQAISEAGQAAYEDTAKNVGEVTANYEQEIDAIKQSDLGTTAALSAQYAELNSKMEDRKNVLSEELGAKSSAAGQNLETLQQMYNTAESENDRQLLESQIASAQSELALYNDYKKQMEDENSTYLDNDSEYKSLKEQRNQIKSQLSEVAAETAALAGSFIKGMLKKDDAARQAEYNEVIQKNFLTPEEAQTQKNINRILKHRHDVLLKDAAHAFYVSAAIKKELDQQIEDGEKYQKNIAAADYKMTAGNLLIEQRIKDIQILYNYTNLTMADMRLKTSQNMVEQEYRVKNYEKNPAVLNLDNYIFTEKDIKSDEGKKSFLDNVKVK